MARTYGSAARPGFCEDGVEYAAADCSEPLRWYLTRIENAYGNAVDIDYQSVFRDGALIIPAHEAREVREAPTRHLLESRFAAAAVNAIQPGRTKRSASAGINNALGLDTALAHTFPAQQADSVFLDADEQLVIGSDTDKLLPIRLRYNGGSLQIDLVYERRPDLRFERRDGIERTLAKREARIEVNAIRDDIAQLSHSHRLSYTQAGSDGRSLLQEIRQEAVDPTSGVAGESVRVRRFEYSDQTLDSLAWDGGQTLPVEGKTLVPKAYDCSDAMRTHGDSSTSLLLGLATAESGTETAVWSLRGRGPVRVTGAAVSASSALTQALNRPLLIGKNGQMRGVFFGDEAASVRNKVNWWPDDEALADTSHVGGLHGDSGPNLGFLYRGRLLEVTPAQLAEAAQRAVARTTLTKDHLISCCSARPGAAGGLYAQARGRPVIAYNEVVGSNFNARYVGGYTGNVLVPFRSQYQYMTMLDPQYWPANRHPAFPRHAQIGASRSLAVQAQMFSWLRSKCEVHEPDRIVSTD